jgi:thymidylate synthase (FAD)
VSYRYVEASQGYWEPKRYRKDSKDIKQGSGKNYLLGMKGLMANSVYESAVKASGIAYNTLLNLGVSKEQARAVLPTATNTEWYWTGSVLAFSRICNLRLDKATQEETREIAQQISDQIKVYFPEAWEALTGEADD